VDVRVDEETHVATPYATMLYVIAVPEKVPD
jgi:hypothetical protein